MRWSLVLSLQFVLTGFSIDIATYNVENLWGADLEFHKKIYYPKSGELSDSSDDLENSHIPEKLVYKDFTPDGSNWFDKGVASKKAEQVLRALSYAGYPDIVALQEFESGKNQSKVFQIPLHNTTFGGKLAELGYKYQIIGPQNADHPTSVTTAFISKLAITGLDSISVTETDPTTSDRALQVVESFAFGGRMVMINNHWKSKRGGASAQAQREFTAKQLWNRLQAELTKDSETKFIILGDFNSTLYESVFKQLRIKGELDLVNDTELGFFNLWYERDFADRWDTNYDGERQALSHILVSNSLYNPSGLVYKRSSFRVIGHEGIAKDKMISPDGTSFRWQKALQRGKKDRSFKSYKAGKIKHFGFGYSDHLPLVASFDVEPKRKVKKKPTIINPIEITVPKQAILDVPKICKQEDFTELDLTDPMTMWGKCVQLNFSEPALINNRDYFHPYVTWEGAKIGLAMNRRFDWRPNIDDSRTQLSDLTNLTPSFGPKHAHPHSNVCFERKVLQKRGSTIGHVQGSFGFIDGYPTVFIASREMENIEFVRLSEKLEYACPW